MNRFKASDYKAKPCHDSQKIQIMTPNDCEDFTIEETRALIDNLKESIRLVEERSAPPGPAPFNLREHKSGLEFGCHSSCDGDGKCFFSLGKLEVDRDELEALRTWFDEVLKYHHNCKSMV